MVVINSLDRAYKVDEAINTREKHIVIVRFARESPENEAAIKKVDQWLKTLNTEDNEVKVFTVSMKAVPELVARYKLSEPFTILFFYNNIQVGRFHEDKTTQEVLNKTVHNLIEKKFTSTNIAVDRQTNSSIPSPPANNATKPAAPKEERPKPAPAPPAPPPSWILKWLNRYGQ